MWFLVKRHVTMNLNTPLGAGMRTVLCLFHAFDRISFVSLAGRPRSLDNCASQVPNWDPSFLGFAAEMAFDGGGIMFERFRLKAAAPVSEMAGASCR